MSGTLDRVGGGKDGAGKGEGWLPVSGGVFATLMLIGLGQALGPLEALLDRAFPPSSGHIGHWIKVQERSMSWWGLTSTRKSSGGTQ
ncbi:hypothetical protein GCM10009800_29350 [Nocardiopsis rhodophaea]